MYLSLGVVVAIRTRQQFGFLAPVGFMGAVILRIILQAAVVPMYSHATSKLGEDDRSFYSGLGFVADCIWHLGVMLFLLCGLLDLRTAAGGFSTKARPFLVMGGALLIVLSAFYPDFWFERLR